MKRTIIKDTVNHIGSTVTVSGWVHSVRKHGKIAFLDLRDRSGLIQAVDLTGKAVEKVGNEYAVEVTGLIKKRPEKMVNPKIITGTVEMEIRELTVYSKSLEPPFPLDDDGYRINEETRIKYRYLDLRRQRMLDNLLLRSRVTTYIRNYLTGRDFIEVETPILTKTTPEGARDFIVPSRLQPGNFYALPQSPQQIAPCFRDEDPRHDRAYGEFTQLDIEMSFVQQEDILNLTEGLFTEMVGKLFPEKHISQKPWPRLAHRDVLKKYGSDKPDLRRDRKDKNELAFAWIIDFPLFKEQSQDDFFYGSGRAKFAPSHHMFTAPHPEDILLLKTDPLKVRGQQHDLVLNGYEVGGGSVRIHEPQIQEQVFDLIGFTKEQKAQFEHLLTAFKYGVPPHGGIAPGIDRFLMTVLGEPSLREVMAFPTLSSGQTSVLDAPSPVTEAQLAELGIAIRAGKKKSKKAHG